MKYLDSPELQTLISQMNVRCYGTVGVETKLEAYSVKRTTTDKKLMKFVTSNYEDEISAPQIEINSPLGPLKSVKTKKLLTNFISTLNMSFPDYDFSYQ